MPCTINVVLLPQELRRQVQKATKAEVEKLEVYERAYNREGSSVRERQQKKDALNQAAALRAELEERRP